MVYMDWQTLRENFNHRIGKQIVLDVAPGFQVILQTQMDDLINRWNTTLDSVALSLVRQDFDIKVYDVMTDGADACVIPNEHLNILKVARIFTTKAPERLINRLSENQEFKVDDNLQIVQAVRLYQNPQLNKGIYKAIQVQTNDSAEEMVLEFVKDLVAYDSEGFQMKFKTYTKEQTDQQGVVNRKQIVVRLSEEVTHKDSGYIPVEVEYIFDQDSWEQSGAITQYRLQLVRFPQDLYEIK